MRPRNHSRLRLSLGLLLALAPFSASAREVWIDVTDSGGDRVEVIGSIIEGGRIGDEVINGGPDETVFEARRTFVRTRRFPLFQTLRCRYRSATPPGKSRSRPIARWKARSLESDGLVSVRFTSLSPRFETLMRDPDERVADSSPPAPPTAPRATGGNRPRGVWRAAVGWRGGGSALLEASRVAISAAGAIGAALRGCMSSPGSGESCVAFFPLLGPAPARWPLLARSCVGATNQLSLPKQAFRLLPRSAPFETIVECAPMVRPRP